MSFRAYAIDLWGFGDTAKEPEKYLLNQQTTLLDNFLSEMGIGKIAIVGHGLGAVIGLLFAERFPQRFFNVGVAEQNMVGLATGLAEAGFIPFVYSIVTFASLRPYEFIRNGPVLHQFPVRGLLKVKTITLWHALCHNFTRMMHMGVVPRAN